MNRAALIPAMLALPSILSACNSAQPLVAGTRTSITGGVSASLSLDAATDNGTIILSRAGDADLTLQASIRALSQERLDAVKLQVAFEGEVARVRLDWPDGGRRGREGADLTISLPGCVGVRAVTGNGRIELSGLGGPAHLRTSNGGVKVSEHSGAVEAHSSNGAIDIRGVSGPVAASTSNGRVVIALAPENPGPVDARTSNGGITLTVGPAFRGSIETSTSNGSISCDAPAKAVTRRGGTSASFVFGDSEPRSSLRTSNGSVSVSAARHAPFSSPAVASPAVESPR